MWKLLLAETFQCSSTHFNEVVLLHGALRMEDVVPVAIGVTWLHHLTTAVAERTSDVVNVAVGRQCQSTRPRVIC